MRSAPMEDIAQTVLNLSSHMMSSLSTSCRGNGGNSSLSPAVDTAFVFGLHNPMTFFPSLFGQEKRRDAMKQVHPWLVAKIQLPFGGFNSSKHDRMTLKSRRAAEVVDREKGGSVQGRVSDSRVVEKTILESASREWTTVQQSVNVVEDMETSSGAAVSKEELGRATWTLLHTLAAQFPDEPTRQQQRDVKDLMGILSRLYPCKECADHFQHVLKVNPVEAKSGEALRQWMCRVHNVVNRSLGKPQFPCNRLDFRWGALNCHEGACDLQGRFNNR